MRTLLALLTALLTAGCLASTDVETMTRPDWEPKPFERIVVYYVFSDLEDRKQVEDRFAAKDSAFVPSYELFFPGRSYSMEEIRSVMDENDVDAALVLNPKGAGSSTAVLPGQYETSCSVSVGGDCQSWTTTGGPTAISKPRADFGAVLLEWEAEQAVWTASAESGGNAFADQGNLRESFVDAMIEKLREDGLLRGGR